MGNFYVNFSVKSTDQSRIAVALSGRTALITPAAGGFTVVYEQESDTQDPKEIYAVGHVLSSTLQTPVLAALNHDDDVLYFWLFENGTLTGAYNSDPGYFGDDEDAEDEAAADLDIQHLCTVLGVPDAVGDVEAIMEDDEYTFAIDRHFDLAETLSLPEWSIGHGYRSIVEGELPDELSADELMRIG